jgi:hypothetical protein
LIAAALSENLSNERLPYKQNNIKIQEKQMDRFCNILNIFRVEGIY